MDKQAQELTHARKLAKALRKQSLKEKDAKERAHLKMLATTVQALADHPEVGKNRLRDDPSSTFTAEMLTPSELDRLRRSTQEADAYLSKAFKNHRIDLDRD